MKRKLEISPAEILLIAESIFAAWENTEATSKFQNSTAQGIRNFINSASNTNHRTSNFCNNLYYCGIKPFEDELARLSKEDRFKAILLCNDVLEAYYKESARRSRLYAANKKAKMPKPAEEPKDPVDPVMEEYERRKEEIAQTDHFEKALSESVIALSAELDKALHLLRLKKAAVEEALARYMELDDEYNSYLSKLPEEIKSLV